MDRDSVAEFLADVPLLQRLPSSSVRKIAQVVEFKHYEAGDLVAREGDTGDGVYFIWEGHAGVSGNDNDEGGNQPELHLKKYDYFGYGAFSSIHEVNISATSKLTCLVLRQEFHSLLQPKSIWNADETETVNTFSMVEHILKLEPLEVDLFRGFTLPEAPRFGQVFGGQTIGQALAAACKTVDCFKLVHSIHACFLLAGDLNMPMLYKVYRLRDGKSFATRKVDAFQEGNLKFSLIASFQKEEEGFDHQEVMMPDVPAPETLLPMEQLWERRIYDPLLPMDYRNKIARKKYIPWPIEIRFCEKTNSTNYSKTKPSLKYWFKTRGKLSDDPALHRCVVAYASDLIFLGVSLNPHRGQGFKTSSLTLDHAMWFHRPCRADEWLLYVMESPSAYNGRGFCTGRIFNRKGELLVSLAQEGVIRRAKAANPAPTSKLTPPVLLGFPGSEKQEWGDGVAIIRLYGFGIVMEIPQSEFIPRPLINGLPDDLALLCLARVPRRYHHNLKCVSKRWKELVDSIEWSSHRQKHNLEEFWIYALCRDSSFSYLYVLDPLRRCWKRIRGIPSQCSKRGGMACQALGKKLYLMGGRGWLEEWTDEVFCFDILKNIWAKAAPMSIARCDFVCEALSDNLYAVGGGFVENDVFVDNYYDMYDPKSNIWTPLTDLHLFPHVAASMTFDGKIYIRSCVVSLDPNVNALVYDHSFSQRWQRVSGGMVNGWDGPTVVVDGALYMLSQDIGFKPFQKIPSGVKLMKWQEESQEWISLGRLSARLIRPPCQLAAIGKSIFVIGKGLTTVIVDLDKVGHCDGVMVSSSIRNLNFNCDILFCKAMAI
ncbi:hypothetical protein H6P81_017120 [Aristolochia fimbriata]|uniref:acyl-CoA hydrolase n=1 Tax=Aristolochia fimbriata TaxID=158543 RepID=A0AAV7E092_ARIFI|nr:hypothetical protein H6P81_017120 [Aristolochia fimbriata]